MKIHHYIIVVSSIFLMDCINLTGNSANLLIARGEHRIEIQNYGRENPEVSIDILQSQFYDEHHEGNVTRFEDLNKTINREMNEEANLEYNLWFENKFHQTLSDYQQAEDYRLQQEEEQQRRQQEETENNSVEEGSQSGQEEQSTE